MSRYLAAAIPGAAVPGFIPGRVIAGQQGSSGAAITPAVLACAATLPLVTVGARVQGKATAVVTNKAAATASVANRALATAGVS